MDYLGATLELKAVRAQERIISGFAAGIGNEDRVQDVILPGAFRKTLASKSPGAVGVFVGHQTHTLPVGVPLVIEERAGGLYTETKIKPGPVGDDLLATAEFLQQHGQALGMSIGYRVPPGGATLGRQGTKMVRKIAELDLLEFSYAASQSIANPAALVVGVKTEEPMDDHADATPITWDAAYLAALPDSAYLRVEAGEQEDGKTVPQSKRHWAYRDAEGKISRERLEAALPDLADDLALQGRVRWLLAQPESKLADADTPEWQAGAAPELYALGALVQAACVPTAEGQKAMRYLGQDTHQGQVIPAEQCAALQDVAARIKAWADAGMLIHTGAYERGRAARWARELELLELGV